MAFFWLLQYRRQLYSPRLRSRRLHPISCIPVTALPTYHQALRYAGTAGWMQPEPMHSGRLRTRSTIRSGPTEAPSLRITRSSRAVSHVIQTPLEFALWPFREWEPEFTAYT